jgi:hypothetical protein
MKYEIANWILAIWILDFCFFFFCFFFGFVFVFGFGFWFLIFLLSLPGSILPLWPWQRKNLLLFLLLIQISQ